MRPAGADLSEEQWRFLSVLEAFQVPVPIDVPGHLAPLLPGPLFDLIGKCEEKGWIRKEGSDRFAVVERLPAEVSSRIAAINTPERLAWMTERIYSENLHHRLDPAMILPLLDKAGRFKEASECETAIARKALARIIHKK